MCKSLSEKLGSTLKLVMLLLLLTNAKNVGAQTGVEDLPAPRIAVKTNLPYWLTLSPNIGAEVGIVVLTGHHAGHSHQIENLSHNFFGLNLLHLIKYPLINRNDRKHQIHL